MAIICRRHNLLFIMTPRTACTAIGDLLCKEYQGEFLPSSDMMDSSGRIMVERKHSTLPQLLEHKVLSAEEAQCLLKLAAVRNPFDSLVSLYVKQRFKYKPLLSDPNSWVNQHPRYVKSMKFAQTHSFEQWIFRVCYRGIIKNLLGLRSSMFAHHTSGMDIVLRYESIEKDLKEAFGRAGIPWKADLPKVNRTDERTDGDYRALYSRAAALTVRFAYAYDLSAYGYKF